MKKLLALLLLLAHTASYAIVNGPFAASTSPIASSVVLLVCIEEGHPTNRIASSGTGVIVGPRLILTAGHIFSICKPGPDAAGNASYRWEIRFGVDGSAPIAAMPITPSDFRNEDTSRLMSPLNVDHATYKDYAFVNVPQDLPQGARQIRVEASTASLAIGDPVYFSGYGYTSTQGTDYRLRDAAMTVSAVDAASPSLPPLERHFNDWDKQFYIELDGAESHPCYGDSGGPFYRIENGEPVLIAILTHIRRVRDRSGYCEAPSVGMRVEAVLDEMRRIIDRPARQ